MCFLGNYTALYDHLADNTTVDLVLCPAKKRILAISPTGIALWSTHDTNPKILCRYNVPHYIQEFGMMTYGAWLNSQSCVILTTFGNIMLFLISDSVTFVFKSVFKPGSGLYTCLTTYAGFVLAGDTLGRIVFLSPEENGSIAHQITDMPIKQVVITQHYGLIFSSDLVIKSFRISPEIIRSPDFDIRPQSIDLNPQYMTASMFSNYAAIYDPRGFLMVTDFATYSQTFANCAHIYSMKFSPDGQSLFALCRGGIGVWTSQSRKFTFITNPDIIGGRAIAISPINAFISITKGIMTIPVTYVQDNTLFAANHISDIRFTTDGCQMFTYVLDTPASYLSAEAESRFFAISDNSKISLLSRTTGKSSTLPQPNMTIIGLQWFGNRLGAVCSTKRNFTLNILSVGAASLVSEKQIPLPGKPLAYHANTSIFVLSYPDKVITIDTSYTQKTITAPPLLKVYASQNKIYGLDYEHQLLEVGGDVLLSNADTFYIDDIHGLVFAIVGLDIFVSPLKAVRFTRFLSTENSTIGIEPKLSALIQVDSKLTPMYCHYFDICIENGHADVLAPLKKRKSALLQVAVFSMRQHRWQACLSFLDHIPELKDEILINALRSVESADRVGILAETGKPSQLFIRLTGCTYERRTFARKCQNATIAQNLLPVILEEEGPFIAFSAALFLLRADHSAIPRVESFLRFIQPILGDHENFDESTVSCGGMRIDRVDFVELSEQLQKTLATIFADLFSSGQIAEAFALAKLCGFDLVDYMQSQSEPAMSMEWLIEKMKDADQSITDAFEHGNWYFWALGAALASKDSGRAKKLVETHTTLKHSIQGSQWQQLVELI